MNNSLGRKALIQVAETILVHDEEISINLRSTSYTWASGLGTLEQRLTEAIYSVCYTGYSPNPSGEQIGDLDDWLIEELSGTLPRALQIDWGWDLEQINRDGSVVAYQRGWRSTFESGAYLRLERDRSPAPITIGIPESSCIFNIETQNIMMRYRLFGIPVSSREIRIYLNVKPEYIVDVLRTVAEELIHWEIPYALKVPGRMSLMRRRDKIVLYLDERDFEVAIAITCRIQRSQPDTFVDDPPLFTCPVVPGLSFAESPSGMQSFGMARAAVCAAALAKNRTEQISSFDTRLEALCAEFLRCGISMERPFLSPNSTFRFDLSLMKALTK